MEFVNLKKVKFLLKAVMLTVIIGGSVNSLCAAQGASDKYEICLGTISKEIDVQKLEDKGYGNLRTENVNKYAQKVYLGTYNSELVANFALEQVKEAGFTSAKVFTAVGKNTPTLAKAQAVAQTLKPPKTYAGNSIRYDANGYPLPPSYAYSFKVKENSKSSKKVSPTNSTAEKINQLTNATAAELYFIQLGAYQTAKFTIAAKSKFDNLTDLGAVQYSIDNPKVTRMYLGAWATEEEARQVLALVKERGFKDAYPVIRSTASMAQ